MNTLLSNLNVWREKKENTIKESPKSSKTERFRALDSNNQRILGPSNFLILPLHLHLKQSNQSIIKVSLNIETRSDRHTAFCARSIGLQG